MISVHLNEIVKGADEGEGLHKALGFMRDDPTLTHTRVKFT